MSYKIEFFKTGNHISMNGIEREYTTADLQEVAESYDPSYFKAPLIFNYNPNNAHSTMGFSDGDLVASPFAFGYPEKVFVNGDRLVGEFEKISPEFVEWNREGKILGVSASFYAEDHPYNPYPGKLSLRHIASLGIEPPAVKGIPLNLSEGNLEDLDKANIFALSNFKESAVGEDDKALSYTCDCNSDYSWQTLQTLMRNLRENIIATKSMDEADKLLPQYLIDSLKPQDSDDEPDGDDDDEPDDDDQAQEDATAMALVTAVNMLAHKVDWLTQKVLSQDSPSNSSSYSESIDMPGDEVGDDEEEPEDKTKKNKPRTKKPMKTDMKTEDMSEANKQEITELRQRLTILEAEKAKENRQRDVDALMSYMEVQCNKHCRILPAQLEVEKQVALAMLQSDRVISFGETKKTALEVYKESLESRPALWDSTKSEIDPATSPNNFSEKELASQAKKLQKKYKEEGKDLPLHMAITKVQGGETPD